MARPASQPAPDAAVVRAPFGAVAIACDGAQITGLRFVPAAPERQPDGELAARAVDQLLRYFSDPRATFDLPLAVVGTSFQRRVWQAISAIPSGEVRRYGDLAAALDAPAQSVGQACGDNRLPIVIPCHRVIAANGIGGFAHASGGFELSVKRWLLEHEGGLRGPLL
jgi:methylated-DNA-[protein]-cysteine S-methyltransferase